MDAKLLGARAGHHQRIGVLEGRVAEQRDALRRPAWFFNSASSSSRGLMSVWVKLVGHSVPE